MNSGMRRKAVRLASPCAGKKTGAAGRGRVTKEETRSNTRR